MFAKPMVESTLPCCASNDATLMAFRESNPPNSPSKTRAKCTPTNERQCALKKITEGSKGWK
eukprot:2354459-Amphidinium_carterae.1